MYRDGRGVLAIGSPQVGVLIMATLIIGAIGAILIIVLVIALNMFL
jgi:hypothetical protein